MSVTRHEKPKVASGITHNVGSVENSNLLYELNDSYNQVSEVMGTKRPEFREWAQHVTLGMADSLLFINGVI